MFIGRENELKIIDECLSRPSCCVLVYGKRRVGKTTLLLHALEGSKEKTVYFECAPNTIQYNADKFVEALNQENVIDFNFPAKDFDDIFKFLNRLDVTLNIVIDEYQFLKEMYPAVSVDGMFQKIADNYLSHIRLFLCGSHVGVMTELLNSGNPLFGRFTRIIGLEEWNYKEASLCYAGRSPYDKVAFYSVFGGSPYLNTEIDAEKSLKENVIKIFLKKDSIGLAYVNQLLMTSSSQRNSLMDILEAIGNGRNKFTEIKDKSQISDNLKLTKILNLAISLRLIKKDSPINRHDVNKKIWYEIDDNAVRFYYTFVHRYLYRLEQIGSELFYDKYVQPKLDNYIPRRFEDICRTYFTLQCKEGKRHDIRGIGTYYYDLPSQKRNGEFDVVLEKELGYDVYEVKYLATKMPKDMMDEKSEKIREIPDFFVDKIGFISVNGFESDCGGILLTGEDLYM